MLIIGICRSGASERATLRGIASAASSYWMPSVRQSCNAFDVQEEALETVPEQDEANEALEED